MHKEESKLILKELIDIIIDYLEESQNIDTKVINYYSADELKSLLDLNLPEKGISLEALIPIIKSYLNYSVKTNNPNFFNLLFSGVNLPSMMAEIVTTATNTTMHTYESAPVATLIELELIKNLNNLVGFKDGEGVMVTGGSNANLMGMLCARHQILPEAKYKGIGNQNLVAFVSNQAHYSYLKAANLLGIGINNLIKVETDNLGSMLPEALETAINNCLQQGKTPFFVGATAGTTVFGAFDPLVSLAKITNKYKLWFHVDGAWGAPVLFSHKYKHLLKGCELADSFTWDAHKLMGIPVICSAILTKNKGILASVCSGGGNDYLFHEDDNESYNLGKMSLSCGRKVDAFKLWLSWQYYGHKGYETRINNLFELQNYAVQCIENSPNLELIVCPQFLNICFRYIDHDQYINLNQLNLKIRYQLIREGKIFVNFANYHNKTFIRLILSNPELTKVEIDHFFVMITNTRFC